MGFPATLITVVTRPDLQARDAGTAPVCLVHRGMACARHINTLPLRITAGVMWAHHKRDPRPGGNVFPTRQSRAVRARPSDMTRGDHRRVDHCGGAAGIVQDAMAALAAMGDKIHRQAVPAAEFAYPPYELVTRHEIDIGRFCPKSSYFGHFCPELWGAA